MRRETGTKSIVYNFIYTEVLVAFALAVYSCKGHVMPFDTAYTELSF